MEGGCLHASVFQPIVPRLSKGREVEDAECSDGCRLELHFACEHDGPAFGIDKPELAFFVHREAVFFLRKSDDSRFVPLCEISR